MDVSLVICTRNRASKLPEFLRSLAVLTGPAGAEIVIVDNGSSDSTAAILANFVCPPHLVLKLVTESNAGLGRARNTGWRCTTAPIVAFTDDDCYVSPTLLADYAELFTLHPAVGCIGGRVLLHDSRDLKITILEGTEEILLPPKSFVRAGFILGANFAFRRSALEDAGGFDERLGAGTAFPAEDVDMIAHVVANGWHALYHPKPTVEHAHGRRTEAELRVLRFSYDAGRGAYYAKYIADQRVRRKYLREWLFSMRWAPLGQSLREIRSALAFLRTPDR